MTEKNVLRSRIVAMTFILIYTAKSIDLIIMVIKMKIFTKCLIILNVSHHGNSLSPEITNFCHSYVIIIIIIIIIIIVFHNYIEVISLNSSSFVLNAQAFLVSTKTPPLNRVYNTQNYVTRCIRV